MKGFLALIAVVILAVIALGFYQGWFHVTTTDTGNNTKVEFNVDKEKVKEDEQKAKEKAKEITKDVKEKVHEATK
jgi:hypothetical protein